MTVSAPPPLWEEMDLRATGTELARHAAAAPLGMYA